MADNDKNTSTGTRSSLTAQEAATKTTVPDTSLPDTISDNTPKLKLDPGGK